MPRRQAGYRYPHASSSAREHDHRFCPVVGAIAQRAEDGTEEWGTPHPLAALPGEAAAVEARRGLFRGRDCARLRKAHGELSVSVTYQDSDGTLTNKPAMTPAGYILVVRVWSRAAAKKEIARRVSSGEPLAYNALRSPE